MVFNGWWYRHLSHISSEIHERMETVEIGNNASSYGIVTQEGNSTTVASTNNPGEFEVTSQALILILVLVISLTGNGLLCYLILAIKQLQIPTNYFILSLALADFLFAAVCLPFRIAYILQKYLWTLGLGMCKFWVWLDLLFCSASIANLAAISVDRYLKIVSPLTYDARMTSSRAVLILVALWGYSISLASLSLCPTSNAPGIVVENQRCFIDNKIFLTVVFVIGFFAPFAIMILMYCFVFKVAVDQAQQLFRQTESLYGTHRHRSRRKSSRIFMGTPFFELKATKTLMILLSVFCICWSPFFVLSLVSLHNPHAWDELPSWFTVFLKALFVHVLPNCNSAFNPIIYTTYNHQFKNAFQQLFKRYRRARSKRSASLNGSMSDPSADQGRMLQLMAGTDTSKRTSSFRLEDETDISNTKEAWSKKKKSILQKCAFILPLKDGWWK